MTRVALTIAGSDPSGGAGIQADLKVFHQHGVYGAAVITLLTVQNTQKVAGVKVIEPQFVLDQLEAVLEDIPPAAIKTGALGNVEVIDAVAWRAARFECPLVVDPVMVSKHGTLLLDSEGVQFMRKQLLTRAFLVTPNVPEAKVLAEREIVDVVGMERAAQSIARMGAKHVLLKGGHLSGEATDVLWSDGRAYHLPAPRISTIHTHGTGCVYSAAITARLALQTRLEEAVRGAKRYVTAAIANHPGLGRGSGPINMFAPVNG